MVTIKEVAQKAGVNINTAIRALNGKTQGKRADARARAEKVLQIAKEMGYVPNVMARALVTKHTYLIGYLVSSKVTLGLANSYFSEIQAGIADACEKHSYHMLVSCYDLNNIADFVVPRKLQQQLVDAVIISGNISPEVVKELEELRIPFIVIGYGNANSLNLCRNVIATYEKIIKYHKELGHQHFATTGWRNENNGVVEAFKKFENAEMRLEFIDRTSDDDFETGRKLARAWTKEDRKSRFTVLIDSDQLCSGFIQAASEAGVKFPDDCSVFSGCDTMICRCSNLKVSAVKQNLPSYGYLSAELLIQFLEKQKTLNEVKEVLKKQYMPLELIIRDTTGKVPEVNQF